MGHIRFHILTAIALNWFLIFQSEQSEGNQDTSLYDFVAYNLLEDYVDLLEMTTWFARKVKNHIDQLIEDSFLILIKHQGLMQPALELAEQLKKPQCSEGKILNITDIVFREYFNMNLNCPMIGQKMALFFNELHNITSRLTDIHRRYIGAAGNCGPPVVQVPDRNCLQNVVNQCKQETGIIRNHMVNLDYDVEEFMDGQMEEAFDCLIKSSRAVRNASKEAVQEIHCCLDIDEINLDVEFESPFVDLIINNNNGQFAGLGLSKEQIKPPPEPHQNNQQHINPEFKRHAPPHGTQHPHFYVPPPPQNSQQNQYQYPVTPKEKREQENNQPPWRTNPENRPKYAETNTMIRDGSFEFDASIFDNFNPSMFEGFDEEEWNNDEGSNNNNNNESKNGNMFYQPHDSL